MADVLRRFVRRSGQDAEKRIGKRLGARQRIASGAIEGMKGDLEYSTPELEFLIENKSTINESFSLKKQQLLKIYQESVAINKTPALSFQFVDSLGRSELRERWVCIPEHIFEELTDGNKTV